ncbi:efflux RND transporter periplasmic adaptor subunit [Aminobacter sp. NyZ550]|uniref:efflux RND transporter periplasmic adaptor subunit n=1 Tax=Aminobacter sp. NyZ550 TaxID=2979870 RepID=UPI0021D5B8F4|nr:efflux RND transporter periplasmic adaptor subunit [Aminobacter sp. NyZ550]WAX95793.1 efflux RND transporter periplasmic adaptor subunit [Aminobacter sp. NyZ550]
MRSTNPITAGMPGKISACAPPRRHLTALALCLLLPLPACQKQETAERQPIVVRSVEVKLTDYAPSTSLTGVIAARTLNNLSFQVGGRVAERSVDIGQRVTKGQVLAKLDPQEQQSDVRAAQASLYAAQAQLKQAAAAFERQKTLLAQGFTTRRDYDQADQAQRVAQSGVESAQSQMSNAEDRLTYTELKASADGVVTARTIEVGQVVQAAQTVFTVAEDGDRDAVFNVDEALVARNPVAPDVMIALISDPRIKAPGQVREVSPAVDPASGSIRVKVMVPNTPTEMPLGAAITGTIVSKPQPAIVLPWQALMSDAGRPAAWTIDPATKAVALAAIEVQSFASGVVVVANGLEVGQSVVAQGGQLLSPGQVVEVAP